MAAVVLKQITVWEMWEVGYGGAHVSYGVYTTEQEALARYREVAAEQPRLAQQGSLGVSQRLVQAVEAATLPPPVVDVTKMRRAGRDYEDKGR